MSLVDMLNLIIVLLVTIVSLLTSIGLYFMTKGNARYQAPYKNRADNKQQYKARYR